MATTKNQDSTGRSDTSRNEAVARALKNLSIALQALPVGESAAIELYTRKLSESEYSTPTIVQACEDLSLLSPESEFARYKFPPLADIFERCSELSLEERRRAKAPDPNCAECDGMGMKIFEQGDGRLVAGPCPNCSPENSNHKGE